MDDPIPLSALQHALYCLRQCALIHIERIWEENRLTAEGRVLHETVDVHQRHRRKGVRVVTSLPIASDRLGLSGVADLVEFHAGPDGETPYPVEYKRGRPKPHRADEVQLCAQALCLEEMTARPVPEGALFYGETRRRHPVAFDPALRDLTETTARRLHAMMRDGRLPPPTDTRKLCRACSLATACQPALAGRSARDWRDRRLTALLDETEAMEDLP